MRLLRYGIVLALACCASLCAEMQWKKLANSLKDKACTIRLLELMESPQLYSGRDAPNLSDYSDDLILLMIYELEQHFGLFCKVPAEITAHILKLKIEYIGRLGITVQSPPEVETLFRGLTVQESASNDLKKKIAGISPKPTSAMEWLKAIYAQAVEINDGVVYIGKDRSLFARAKAIFDTFPDGYDPRLINRVLFTQKDGVAVFVPELGLLLLSESLVLNDNLLHRTIVMHELSHVVIRRWELEDVTYLRSYAALSGWDKVAGEWVLKVKNVGDRRDELTELSKGSAFSVLPDGVLFPVRKGDDGFVLQRSYDETKKRNDLSEDIADHMAIAFLVPERFCWNGRPLAKRKFEWVKKRVKRVLSIPSCLR